MCPDTHLGDNKEELEEELRVHASSGRHVALENWLCTSLTENIDVLERYSMLGKTQREKQAIGLSLQRREHRSGRGGRRANDAKRSVEDERRGIKINWEEKDKVASIGLGIQPTSALRCGAGRKPKRLVDGRGRGRA